jgi:MFS family permease
MAVREASEVRVSGDVVAAATEEGKVTAWSPFRHRVFAVLWVATLLANIGGWRHDVGAGWLRTPQSPSPLLVSLEQAATTLPVFVLALPAGALADIVDRKRLLLIAKIYMTVIAAGMGVAVLAGGMTPVVLLVFTLALGSGTALINPAWQAIVPQLVPRQELASAVALNSVGINVSRAIGPALAGAAIATLGLASPFLFNAVSFLAVIGALLWWSQPTLTPRLLPAERWVAAMRGGLRYARASRPLKSTLGRAVGFLLFASAYWALLPLIARQQLGGNAELYGVLVTCIGVGAVSGATMLPRVRKRYGASRLVVFSSVGTAAVLVAFALLREPALVAGTCVLAGATWIAALSSFNVSAQMSLPDWVRARGLAIFSAVLFGSLALGSALWGQVAAEFGIPGALLVAAGGALLIGVLTGRMPLQSAGDLDLTPAAHWPQPVVSGSIEPDSGPIMVTVEYRVDPRRATDFLSVLEVLAQARRRDGAFSWGVFRDAAESDRFLEYFFEESWTEHLRHHSRVTQTDRDVEARVREFHRGPAPPRVTHYLAADASMVPPAAAPNTGGRLR